jgi:hypothetical protein
MSVKVKQIMQTLIVSKLLMVNNRMNQCIITLHFFEESDENSLSQDFLQRL